MEPPLLQKFADKRITKEDLYKTVECNFDLMPDVLNGVASPKAAVRYGCAAVLMILSDKHPEQLYPYMDNFIALLDSQYRILTWNAMSSIANLCSLDKEKKFDAAFDKFFGLLNSEYLVTVANVVGNSAKIVQAKPYLIPMVTEQLLKVEKHATSPHLTEECKRVLAEITLESFTQFFDGLTAEDKAKVLAFAKRCAKSPRARLKTKAELFLKNWSQT